MNTCPEPCGIPAGAERMLEIRARKLLHSLAGMLLKFLSIHARHLFLG